MELICSTLHKRNRLNTTSELLNVGFDRRRGRWIGKISLVVKAQNLGRLILLYSAAEMKLLGGTGGGHRKGGMLAVVDAVDVLLVLHGDDFGEGLMILAKA